MSTKDEAMADSPNGQQTDVSRRANSDGYRIVEKVNKVSGEKRYIAQVKSLWFWCTCQIELGWNCSEDAIFNSREAAQRFIDKRRIEDAW